MPMLNYLAGLPAPDQQASMPAGIPGSGAPQDPTLTASQGAAALAGPAVPPGPSGPVGGPPPSAGGPPGAPMGAGPGGPPMVPGPGGLNYSAETQMDGSVLLYVMNPDGSRGPAVKIIPSPMGKKAGAPGGGVPGM